MKTIQVVRGYPPSPFYFYCTGNRRQQALVRIISSKRMDDQKSRVKRKSKWPTIISLFVVGAIVASYFLFPGFQNSVNEGYRVLSSNDRERISDWVSRFGYWGPLVILLVMILQMFLFVIPSIVVMMVTILAYGPLWGSVITVAGILLASSLGYSVGAYLGPVVVKKMIGPGTERKLCGFMKDYGMWAVIIARINPLLSNDATSFVGGLLRMGYGRFIAGTFAGILPLTIGIAILGENFQRMTMVLVWVSVVSIVALGLYVVYDKKRKSPIEETAKE